MRGLRLLHLSLSVSAAAAEYMAQGKPFIFVTRNFPVGPCGDMAIRQDFDGGRWYALSLRLSPDRGIRRVLLGRYQSLAGDGYVIIDQLKLVSGDVIQIDGETGDVYRPQ